MSDERLGVVTGWCASPSDLAEAARRRAYCECGRTKASYESRCVYCREPMVGDD